MTGVTLTAPHDDAFTTLHVGDRGTVLTVSGADTRADVGGFTVTGGRVTAPLPDGRLGGGGLRCGGAVLVEPAEGEEAFVALSDALVTANSAPEGRASAELMRGDLGEPGTADDNAPVDITTATGGDVSAGDDLLGWCTAAGCRWLEE